MLLLLCSKTHRPPLAMRGFTLQEALVCLLIGGTLITGGATVWGLLEDSAKTAAANDLVAHLSLARSEALKRQTRVNICASKDLSSCVDASADLASWHHGWVVYVDRNRNGKIDANEILRVHPAVNRRVVIHTSAARREIGYQPTGSAGGSTVTFALCDARGAKFARYVIVSNSGRARVARKSDSAVHC